MKTCKQVLCAALLLALLLSLGAVNAAADDPNAANDEKWNIILVIDGSGSMDHTTGSIPSDPMGLRYYAVANFLGTLNDDSVNVGTIVFTSTYKADSSFASMSMAARTLDMVSLALPGSRDKIMNFLDPVTPYCVEDYIKYGGANNRNLNYQTDIGTALLVACNMLENAREPGRREAIFLFTDGETEVIPALEAQSEANKETALQTMRDQGILLCGIYLNNSGERKTEVAEIVQLANGISASDGSMRNLYMEIRDARDCIDATDMFLRALGYTIDKDSEIITSTTEKTFLVPGVGVLDATIRLYTVDGQPLPEGLEVSFLTPSRRLITGAEADALCYTWASSAKSDIDNKTRIRDPISRVYKLKNPESGMWTVSVKVPEGNTVEIRYSPSFNVDIGAEIETLPDLSQIRANSDVQVNAYLTQGARLTDPRNYDYYQCRLFYQVDAGPEQELEMSFDNGGFFTATIPMNNFGHYRVQAQFYFKNATSNKDDIPAWSQVLEWDLNNTPPTVRNPEKLVLRYGLFQSKETSFDLSPYASDQEDGSNLSFRLTGGTCDLNAVSQTTPDGPALIIRNREIGSGSIFIEVTDSSGSTAQMAMQVQTRNMTPLFIMIFAAALLLLILMAVLIIRRVNRRVDGRCTLSFHVGDLLYELDPAVPGTGDTKRSTDMLAIVNSVVRADSDRIDTDKLEEVKSFVQQHAAELRSIKVKTATGKIKTDFTGKKETVGMLRVRGKGQDVRLYNRSVRLVDGLFEFGFYPPDDEVGSDDSYDGEMSGSRNSYSEDASYGSYGDSGSYGSYDGGNAGGYGGYGGYSSGGYGSGSSGGYDAGGSGGYDAGGSGGYDAGGSGGYGGYDNY